MAVNKVTAETFDTEVLQSDKPVLVDFYADWCGPCKMLSPIVDAIAEENGDFKVCKLNVDDASDIAAQYSVMSIPTLIVFKGGSVANKTVGVQSRETILAMMK